MPSAARSLGRSTPNFPASSTIRSALLCSSLPLCKSLQPSIEVHRLQHKLESVARSRTKRFIVKGIIWGIMLSTIALFLTAAVVFVPLFKRFGLGAVLGYLAAGIAIGPHGLSL